MSNQPDGGPAFSVGNRYEGMTLRDYFAGQALVGLLSGRHGDSVGPDWDCTQDAYLIADGMIMERNKT